MIKHSGGGGGGGTRGTMVLRRWPCLRTTSSAFLMLMVLLVSGGTDAIFSDVEISNFEQSALELSFRVSWNTAGEGASAEKSKAGSDTVDVWLLTRQPNPSSWMETVLKQVRSYSKNMITRKLYRLDYVPGTTVLSYWYDSRK